ncbi:LOW QUALITY PROTEIN: uncharacterized protein LOC117331369 [Pecten maximus]|uniref:LOW QUALITY PROTEIN: uncharacterized protein LOC117331369 n=1 Tax=Pecten maximus TaxID=6579 RepID=UPI001457E7C8|nr:LOW QUALITY PROTEIN: uncharacterized protein LOC117331369 [Pecten maximus]
MCSILVNVKRSLFGGSSYNCRRHEAAWSGSWGFEDGSDDEDSESPNSPPWKFWRKFSLRRKRDQKFDWGQNDSTDGSPGDRDKSLFRRSNSLKPPPKPPRLFIFRSSSISTPRNSAVISGSSDRNSYVMSQAYQNNRGKDGNIPTAHVAPVRKENGLSSNTAEKKKMSENNNIEISKPVLQKTTVSKLDSEISSLNSSLTTGKIKIVTPDLTPRRTLTRRKKSTGSVENERHRVILQSASELICQKLDPSELLDDLHAKQVISSVDIQAFRGHPDRRLVCESMIHVMTDGKPKQFDSFCDILRASDAYHDIALIMDAMSDVYSVIGDIPCPLVEDTSTAVEEEKTINFDVGYYNCDTEIMTPVIQLERARGDSKRFSRDSTFYKRCSRLSYHSITSADALKLDDDMQITGTLVITVCISGYSLHGERSKALAEMLVKHSCILELHIGKTQMSGKDIGFLSEPLQSSPHLSVLDLRLNSIGNEGAKMLASALNKNTSIRQLNLSSTGVDSEGCKHLGEALKHNPGVTDLDMSFLDIADSGCISLGNMLKQNKSLKKLRLRSANISWIGCGILFEGVQQSRTLTELDLSRNFIGDDGMEMMCRHLNDKSTLVDLNLENCGITSGGCAMLSDVILMNKTLHHLDLSVNFIADAGILKISNALERNKSIKTLGLNMCGITNDGFSKILDILECNPTLTLLKLCYNRLGREHTNPSATSDDLRYRVRIVTSSNPKLKLLLWGNAFDEA